LHFDTQEYYNEHYIAKFSFKRLYAFDKHIDVFFEIMKTISNK